MRYPSNLDNIGDWTGDQVKSVAFITSFCFEGVA